MKFSRFIKPAYYKAFLKKYPRKVLLLAGASVGAVILVAVSMVVYAHASKPVAVSVQHTNKQKSKKVAATDSQTTEQATTDSPQPATASTQQSTTSAQPAKGNGTVASGIDFTLSTTSVTVVGGDATPAIRATSSSGKALSWSVYGGGLLVGSGTVGYGEVSHEFNFKTVGVTKVGVYTATVRGYISGGGSVTKNVTITVTQGPTFRLVMLAPDYSQDAAQYFYVPFQVQTLGSQGNYTASATIVDTGGNQLVVNGVESNGGSISSQNKRVSIYDNGQSSGHIVVRVTVSDGAYTSSLDIPYDIQSN